MKKKRKAPGVAAAVAEDAGLKKCKISRYLVPHPAGSPSSGAGQAAGRLLWRGGEPSPRRDGGCGALSLRSARDQTSCWPVRVLWRTWMSSGVAPHCCLRAQRVGNRQPYVNRALSPCLLPSSCPPNAECRSAEIHSVPGVHYIKKNWLGPHIVNVRV